MAPSVNFKSSSCPAKKDGTSDIPGPFAPITSSEITQCAALLRKHTGKEELFFKVIDRKEPPKALVLEHIKAEKEGRPTTPLARLAYANFYHSINCAPPMKYALVNVTNEQVLEIVDLPGHCHGRAEGSTMQLVVPKMLENELVKQELERLKLPSGSTVHVEPWPFGTDGTHWDHLCFQGYFYLRNKSGAQHNYYAHPLDFTCVYDIVLDSVVEVVRIPINEGETERERMGADDQPYAQAPDSEYAPEYQSSFRSDYRPIRVSQPEGPSFEVDGNYIRWQKWDFHLGFNFREGPVIHNLVYDGRPTWYRLSLSEMFVPYGDPQTPFHRV